MEERIYIKNARMAHEFVHRLEHLQRSFAEQRLSSDTAEQARTIEFFVRLTALVEQVKFALQVLNLSFEQLQAMTGEEFDSYIERSAAELACNLHERSLRTYRQFRSSCDNLAPEALDKGFEVAMSHLIANIVQSFWPIEAYVRDLDLPLRPTV